MSIDFLLIRAKHAHWREYRKLQRTKELSSDPISLVTLIALEYLTLNLEDEMI